MIDDVYRSITDRLGVWQRWAPTPAPADENRKNMWILKPLCPSSKVHWLLSHRECLSPSSGGEDGLLLLIMALWTCFILKETWNCAALGLHTFFLYSMFSCRWVCAPAFHSCFLLCLMMHKPWVSVLSTAWAPSVDSRVAFSVMTSAAWTSLSLSGVWLLCSASLGSPCEHSPAGRLCHICLMSGLRTLHSHF